MSESLAWYAVGVVFAALWLPMGVKLLAGGQRRYAAQVVD